MKPVELERRAAELFKAALDCQPAQRPEYLQRACGGDEPLRAAVEALLEADSAATGFLEPRWEPAGAMPVPVSTSRGIAPDSFAGYEILKEIHRGGQGVVYEALQKSTRRKVALKVMREGPFATPGEQARFDREVQILAQLNDPNIVAIHDSGQAAGCHYFVMDYIGGQPLDVWAAAEPRSVEQMLRLFAKICGAVNAAHVRGITHRDLKPGNIRIDEKGEPHILDFGLAKVAHSADAPSTMTLAGQFLGSLPWASPEQAESVPSKIDLRTDVYSLGVILYHMLTGRFPYDVNGNMHDVLDRIMRAEPERPSTIRKQINNEVQTIVLKCLQKDPERRYQSADELARDVAHYLAGEPIEAKRDSAAYVLRKYLRRYRLPAAVAVSFVIVATVGLVGSLTFWHQAVVARRHADETARGIKSLVVLPLENLSGDPEHESFADGMTEELIGKLQEISPQKLRVPGYKSAMHYKGKRAALPDIGRTLDVNYALQGTIRGAADRVHITAKLIQISDEQQLWGNEYDRAFADIFAVQSEVVDSVAKALAMELLPEQRAQLAKAPTADPGAHALYLHGRYFWNKRTKEGLEKALTYFEQAIAKDPSFALAYLGLADTHYALGNWSYLPTQETVPKAKELISKALALDPTLGEAHCTLALILSDHDWDFAGAEKEFQRGLELAPNYATGHQWYSNYLQAMGRLDEGLAEAEQAVSLDPLCPMIIVIRGYCYYLLREYDQAIADYQHAFELAPDLPVHLGLATFYARTGRPELALRECEIQLRLGGATPEQLEAYRQAYTSGGLPAAARWLLNLAEQRWPQVDAADIGAGYAKLGEVDRAFEWLNRAYEQRGPALLGLNVNPAFDALRSDPRFDELVRRVGLPRRGPVPAELQAPSTQPAPLSDTKR